MGYALFSYALIFQAIGRGNAAEILIQGEYEAGMVEAMIGFFSEMSYGAIVLLLVQAVAILVSQLLAALLVYRAMRDNNKRALAGAFAVVWVFDFTYLVLGAVMEGAALAAFAALFAAVLYYCLKVRGNVVEEAMAEREPRG